MADADCVSVRVCVNVLDKEISRDFEEEIDRVTVNVNSNVPWVLVLDFVKE